METISSNFSTSKPYRSEALAPSVAYPSPQNSGSKRQPTSIAGVKWVSKPIGQRPIQPIKSDTFGTETAQSPHP